MSSIDLLLDLHGYIFRGSIFQIMKFGGFQFVTGSNHQRGYVRRQPVTAEEPTIMQAAQRLRLSMASHELFDVRGTVEASGGRQIPANAALLSSILSGPPNIDAILDSTQVEKLSYSAVPVVEIASDASISQEIMPAQDKETIVLAPCHEAIVHKFAEIPELLCESPMDIVQKESKIIDPVAILPPDENVSKLPVPSFWDQLFVASVDVVENLVTQKIAALNIAVHASPASQVLSSSNEIYNIEKIPNNQTITVAPVRSQELKETFVNMSNQLQTLRAENAVLKQTIAFRAEIAASHARAAVPAPSKQPISVDLLAQGRLRRKYGFS